MLTGDVPSQVLPFVLAWKINGKPGSFGTYYKDELKRGMKLEK